MHSFRVILLLSLLSLAILAQQPTADVPGLISDGWGAVVPGANTGAARPNRIADGNLPSDQRSTANWFDKAAFIAPTPYNFGNAGRNILIGPGATNLDASIFKNFPLRMLGEGGQVQFRAEAFNSLNHPQFGQPNTRVDIAQGGTITSLSNDMRQIQFALKILF
jgi:hypothetical protein